MPSYSTGWELILNACEGSLQIALTNDEELQCFQEWQQPKQATETLAPALENIFNLLGLSVKMFRRIACVCGPGSFTGIRLILATAAAFRRVGQAQLASLDYLQALASSTAIARGLAYGEKIFVLTHARRELLHFREYVSYGPQIPAQPLGELELLSPLAVLNKINGQACHVCGSGIVKYPEVFNDPYANLERKGFIGPQWMPNLDSPSREALCLLARHGDYFPKDLEPLYVRSCDAVDNLESMAQRMGTDPKESMEKLTKLLEKAPESDL